MGIENVYAYPFRFRSVIECMKNVFILFEVIQINFTKFFNLKTRIKQLFLIQSGETVSFLIIVYNVKLLQ